MNFLAHLYLSGNSEDILFGNFIGDFVKGNAYEEYPESIQRGILLHRKIDHFTDHHPVVSASKDLLREKYRHYAGVIVDMFYDHFLAADWENYHKVPLPQFTARVYAIMTERTGEMPAEASRMLTYMARHNWLLSYAQKEGIGQALRGIARRTTFTSHMEKAITDLESHYKDFRNHFRKFFPDLMNMVASENAAFSPPA